MGSKCTCRSLGFPPGSLGIVRKLQAVTEAVSAVCKMPETKSDKVLCHDNFLLYMLSKQSGMQMLAA